jgi:hypothetical protein
MAFLRLCFTTPFAILMALQFAGCNSCNAPTNPPKNQNPPTLQWGIQDVSRGTFNQFPSNSVTTSMSVGPGDTVNILVSAQSPDGVTDIKLSGAGSVVCIQTTPGGPAGPGSANVLATESLNPPSQNVQPNPPQISYFLVAPLQMPCSGLKPSGSGTIIIGDYPEQGASGGNSGANFNATATNASGNTATGTLKIAF